MGLVGATGSFESLVDSNKLISKAIWLVASKQVGYNPRLASQFDEILTYHAPGWMSAHKSRYRRLRRMLGDLTKQRPQLDDAGLAKEYEEAWQSYLKPGGPYGVISEVGRFPNAHLGRMSS